MQEATDSQLLSRLLGGLGLTIGGFRSLVMKSSPTYGQVHVPTAGAERRVRKASDPGDVNPPLNNQDVALAHEALFPEPLPPEEPFQMAAEAPRRISTVAMVHDGHLLMGKRRDNGKWTVPGGHVDEGEDHQAGALREVEEETGVKLSADDVEPLTDVHVKGATDDHPRELHVQPFVANLDERPATSMREDPDAEVHRWQWVDVSGGLPDHIAENLHVPLGDNVLMDALGLAGDGDGDEDVLMLDLGSGTEREPDHVGVDLYPYDDETLVHDLNLGIPFEDGSAAHVNLCNALHDMELDDKDGLLSEICRVLADGGTCSYEGPEALEMPFGMEELEHTQGAVDGADGAEWHKQTFMRQAAEAVAKGGPGSGRYPAGSGGDKADHINGKDAIKVGDLVHTSEGDKGTVKKIYELSRGRLGASIALHGEDGKPTGDLLPVKNHSDGRWGSPIGYGNTKGFVFLTHPPKSSVSKSRANAEKITKGVQVAFAKKSSVKQIVYCVVLAPNEADEHEDFMLPEDIEAVAHLYMLESRVVGAEHTKIIKAAPVESYIMPMDMVWEGVDGEPQKVKKGSWCAAIKIFDKREWARVEDGTYTGLSLSGVGVRDDMEQPGSAAGAVRKDDVPDPDFSTATQPIEITGTN